MAKKLNYRKNVSVLPGLDDFSGLPSGAKRTVPLEQLTTFPGNESLVGSLPEKQKTLLSDDILKNGIREALQIWPKDGKLLVVSGNERLSILRSFPSTKKPAGVPCEIRHFESWAEARNHVISINENRKTVKLPPVERIIRVFPPEEYPWLWANLRARSEEFEVLSLPGGNYKLSRPVIADVARAEQSEARSNACAILGWSDSFLKKTLSLAGKNLKTDDGTSSEKNAKFDPSRISILIIKNIQTRLKNHPDAKEQIIKDLTRLIKDLKKSD